MTFLQPGDGSRAEIIARLHAFESDPSSLFDELVTTFGERRAGELWAFAEAIYDEDHTLALARHFPEVDEIFPR